MYNLTSRGNSAVVAIFSLLEIMGRCGRSGDVAVRVTWCGGAVVRRCHCNNNNNNNSGFALGTYAVAA